MTKRIPLFVLALGLVALLIYLGIPKYDMGDRRSFDFKALAKERNAILFIAEREANPYCKIQLKDDSKMDLEAVFEKGHGTKIITGNYLLSGDTIIFNEDLGSINQYVRSSKFLISGNNLLGNKNKEGLYDTTSCLKIQKNKLKH